MKAFEYGDQEISSAQMAITIASILIDVGILNLPREVAEVTEASDGWISIAAAGLIAVACAWIIGKLAIRVGTKGLYGYSASVITKPLASIFMLGLSVYFLLFSSYEVRSIANTSKQYLFEQTPAEVIALIFLLVVAYAVSGTRVGLIRLNVLFLPLVIVIAIIVTFCSYSIFSFGDLKPFFISDWKQIVHGMKRSEYPYLGFETILIYISIMNKPKDAPKAAMLGVIVPTVLYLLIYITAVGVFSNASLREIKYPTLELAKEVRVPGQFFERFESMLFTIWLLTVFNTMSMAFDSAIYCLSSLFRKVKRTTWVIALCPLIYLTCMVPQDNVDFDLLGKLVCDFANVFAYGAPILILLISLVRRRKSHVP
ncbi:GerAB/ArcD/ProY family transporter [Paenibacillus athensensis]|nr:endospore germination permease [Paenibacillus athensensis]